MMESSKENSKIVALHGHHKRAHKIHGSRKWHNARVCVIQDWMMCKVETCPNTRKHKGGSNSPTASRTKADK